MPINVVITGPLLNRGTGKLRAVITDDAGGLSINSHMCNQFMCHPRTRDTGVSHQAQIFAAAIVVHCQHGELAARAKRVRHQI